MSKKTAMLDLTGQFTKDMLAKLDRAERQRDALLAAAKGALDALESQHEDSDETVLELRKAIQQAEGDSK